MDKDLIITVGNIYLDYNIFGVDNGGGNKLEVGKDYFAQKSEMVIGGSAINFSIQAVKLGNPVVFIGKVGDDESGKEAIRLLKRSGINSDLVSIDSEVSTSVAYNMILSKTGEFIGTHCGNASSNVIAEQIDFQHPLFKKSSAVYFGGTNKQGKIIENFKHILSSLQKEGKKVIIDPNRFSPDSSKKLCEILRNSLQYVDYYLPNEEEIMQVAVKNSLDEALEVVISSGVKVIVKQGAKGCRVKTQDQDFQVSGFNVKLVTTVGAGDAFNAGFIAKLMDGSPLEECARFANATAAIKVSNNYYPDKKEVEQFIKQQ